jgi:hypothetical protein
VKFVYRLSHHGIDSCAFTTHIMDMTATATGKSPRKWLREKRIRRVQAEIALLERMDVRLWRLGWLCVAAIVAGLAVFIWVAIEVAFSNHGSEHVFAAIGALLLSVFLVAAWRNPIGGAVFLGLLVISILLSMLSEDIVHINADWPPKDNDPSLDDRKERLRRRVQHALQKRKDLLKRLGRK